MTSRVLSPVQKVPDVLKIQAYSERIENEERETVVSYISQLEEKNRRKEISWRTNRKKNGTKFDSLNLKSNLKKINIFLKKLKQFSSAQLEVILKDINNLNLSKFLSEIVNALINCILKISDINAAVKVSSELHLIYVDFANDYLASWKKCLYFNENSPVLNRRKYKVDLIFFCELIVNGILHTKESLDFLHSTLSIITKEDLRAHQNIDIVYTFCKHCAEDFMGAVPKNIRILSSKHNIEIPSCRLILTEFQEKIKVLLKDYHDSMISSLIYKYEAISKLEMRYNEHLLEKGDIHPDKLKRLETSKKELNKLKSYTDKLSNVLDFCKLSLKANGPEVLACDIHGLTPDQLILEMWGDEDTNKFYNELPSIEEYMLLNSRDSDPNFEINDIPSATEENIEVDTKNDDLNVEDLNLDMEWNEEEDSADQLDIFFKSLSNCLNKCMIDNGAIEFLITNNTKEARNKLAQYIYCLPRTRYDLFPFICRFLAIVSQAYPDIAKRVSDMYYKQFRYLIVKKVTIQLPTKIKSVKIIAELVKFKLFSNIYGLYCLKLLLQDLSHHHIEMACVFLENCGRFLYFSPETHVRTRSYLEQMLARKNNIIMDLKYKNMIDSIYHMIIPNKEPSIARKASKRKPLMLEFIRHLIYTKLDIANIATVRDLIDQLNWDDPKTEQWIIQCLSNPSEIKFNKINSMAMLVQQLVDEYEEAMIQVIDNVVEGIRLGLEMMDKTLYQRRISMAAYLGELFVHCDLVTSFTLFTTLYTIITYFVHIETASDLCRIALVLTILDACANHFPPDVYENELYQFLTHFQCYFMHKTRLWSYDDSRFKLMLLKQKYDETMQRLYPDNKLFESSEEPMYPNYDTFLNISQKYNLKLTNMSFFADKGQHNFIESARNNDDEKHDRKDDYLFDAFEKLVVNSVKERTDTVLSPNVGDITIPVVKKSQGHGEAEAQFFMLVRKANHRPMLKEIAIPLDSEIVLTLKSSQKSQELEMNRVKQITLDYNKRLLEEDSE